MTNLVNQSNEKALTTPGAVASQPHIGVNDFVAAKILPIQKMSKKASDKASEAEVGDMRDTIEDRKFGDVDTPMTFIPVHMTSFWVESDVTGGGQGKYLGQIPITSETDNLKMLEEIGGKKIKRVRTYECYVLLPEEIKAGTEFPYVLSFRVTSSRAGKVLLSQMYVKNQMAGKSPYATACQLSLSEESNDEGDFLVQHIKPLRAATAEEMQAAAKWHGLITSGQVQKDDSDIVEMSEEPSKVSSEQF